MAQQGNITSYKWAESGDIAQVDIRKDHGGVTAYIYANENAGNLHQLRQIFRGQGWSLSPDTRQDKPVLRLAGLQNEDDLLNLLQRGGYAQGQPAMSSNAPPETERSFSAASIKHDSMRLSGVLYLIGDVLFMMSGVKRGNDLSQMGTGIAFGAGDAAFMALGGHSDRRQFDGMLKKLRKHLDRHGVEVPAESALNAETMARPGGFLERINEFAHEHINTFKILAEVVGGAFYFNAGRKQQNPRKQAAGAVIVTGWLASLLVREKKFSEEEQQDAGVLKKISMKIQSQPLLLAGGAGLIHNALSTVGAFEERNKYHKGLEGGTPNYKWDLAGISAMVLANSLFSISKKTGRSNAQDDALINDVYGMAAQVLSHQPEKVREAVLQDTAEFLGHRPEIKETKTQIIERLHHEIETLNSKNPWFDKAAEQQQMGHRESVLAGKSGATPGEPGRS
ncbi:MAG TPA: hypothetical protein VFT64_04095 [Rickettsiales bacterium]|nr:hypothetical protein [Rickettsiales bacterium]